MKYITFLVTLGIYLPFISSRHTPFFRKDYIYNEEFDAFYKIHWDSNGLNWNSVFLACDDESSILFYPKEKDEWKLVKNLTDNLKDVSNVTEIFVGIHDKFKAGELITVDGHPTPSPIEIQESDLFESPADNCVVMEIETGIMKKGSCISEPNTPLPFICKKVDIKLCPTIDGEYQYYKSSRKCYKVNKRERTWDSAMRTCYMEGGLLVAVENQEEVSFLRNIIRDSSDYHIGFRRTFPGDSYYTVTGKKLNDVYIYDGLDVGRLRYECGSLYRSNPYITTHNCNEMLPFICEMQANV